MNTKWIDVSPFVSQLQTRFRELLTQRDLPPEELPLRAELFSADQMEQHGKSLALAHSLTEARAPDQLLRRLAANAEALSDACKLLTEAVMANRRITPAGEWLLDNFYLIEEQIRTARRHFPKGYSRELPRLAQGPSAGLPRVYDIALEAIAHGDGRVDAETLIRFITAYQTVNHLKLGELWAVPIMLRLALIENLRRVAVRVGEARLDRNLADSWADQMTEMAESDPKSLILVVSDMARSQPPMTTAFVSELVRQLQGQSSALALPLTWIEQHLAESGLTIEQLVQAGNQQQASDQVTVSNSIGSLRFLGEMDWREFVEMMSVVHQTLRADPAGVYDSMDFSTRDRYRHVIERIAKQSSQTEVRVAEIAVGLAQESGPGARPSHIGFFLIDKGLTALERTAHLRLSRLEVIQRKGGKAPLLWFLGAIALITAVFSGSLIYMAWGSVPDWLLALSAIISLIGTSQLAVGMVNWLATLWVTPHALPRMDYSKGIDPASRTLVVVPSMLTSMQGIDELIEDLEVRFLGNRDDELYFGLLTDWRDAPQESLAEDAELAAYAGARIAALNEQYAQVATLGAPPPTRFFLFHRPRRWNPHERVWMGHERKRGKLGDLNALLRGDVAVEGTNRFALIVGDTTVLRDIRYVITLDADTQLPRDSARKFVATMAHPLNHPAFVASDEAPGNVKRRRENCVLEGYAILQPRVAVSLPGSNRSRYAQLFGGDPGIDPYTRTVSDVYQDVFGEGSFIGKGIYDVDAFERALAGRFPDNQILSHDLIEGCYARAGLISDAELYETYPSRYGADVSRRHRWIRGDWQLLPQLLGSGRKGLSGLSSWKLFDNLRRSLVPLALTLMLVLGWTALPFAWVWTLSVLAIVAVPSLSSLLIDVFRKPPEMLLRQHLVAVREAVGRHVAHVVFGIACLPYEALYSVDAILRTLWRLTISHRHLLEWNPSGNVKFSEAGGVNHGVWMGPALSGIVLGSLLAGRPWALIPALPILFLWCAAPAIVWWVSRTLPEREASLSLAQVIFLRNLSRRTWEFFQRFVNAENNWLPPDNYQEYPIAVVAHRTSPTNIGMALLANLTAYDFGYIGVGEVLVRTERTLQTMDRMDRHLGHLYNWYDTRSLQPLHPIYISTVDSGNLAGHLMTLKPGLEALANEPILNPRVFEGLDDTLRVLVEASAALPQDALSLLLEFQRDLELVADARATSLVAAHRCLERMVTASTVLASYAERDPEADANLWAQSLASQCRGARDELTYLAPWLMLPVAPPGCELFQDMESMSHIPTLRELALFESTLLPSLRSQQADALASEATPEASNWLDELHRLVGEASARAQERLTTIDRLAIHACNLSRMEYGFLYDETRHLLAIGYNLEEHRRDTSFYDLLASEARLCSFVAIAQGQIPQENWFALGRLLASSKGQPILMSWSGSMFEYLMPLLVMPTFENTLLDQTNRAVVQRQIEYGKQRGVAWGVSESGYNTVDAQFNYQYRAFGVPGLGLKRGLAEDLVIAPYASAMGLMVAPEEACENLQALAGDGMMGRYGLYEAVDYTPVRQRRGESRAIVRSFMAHHQGMSFLSLSYLLHNRPMQRRFESDPLFQATMLLLQERIPKATAFHAQDVDLSSTHTNPQEMAMPIRVLSMSDTPIPEVQLLSNGRYNVMVTNGGGGYSRWNNLDVTRWREDTTCDNWGSFCYIRDVASGSFWSTAHQPTRKRAERFEAIFSEGRAEFRRRDNYGDGGGSFDTHTEIVVSPEDDIELRRVRITNRSRMRRVIDVTSYAEVVLAPAAADAAHPAFSNLFVQTEIVAERRAILCTRRARSQGEAAPWMLHLMTVHGASVGEVSYETDRMRFVGRGNSVAAPQVMTDGQPLSGTQGSVLDPIVAIRYSLTLEPEQTATIDIVSGMTETREAALSLVDKYHDRRLADRVFELAWTHSQVVLRQINATEADAQLYGRLASSVLYANAALRAEPSIIMRNRRGQSGLWGYSISGDLPIVLVQISSADNIDLVRQMVQARAYWRLKGLVVDLVIWNEDHAGYRQQLQDQITGLISAGVEANVIDKPGGIFVRLGEQISNEDRMLLQSVARVIISDTRGKLADQLSSRALTDSRLPRLVPTRVHSRGTGLSALSFSQNPTRDLRFFNGTGGFSADGREYVIAPEPGKATPAPWSNVIANPHFGTVISESGMAYTWGGNAHEYRLTPWHNDPVSDAGGEACYLRDEESGYFWSPTPLPCRGETPYITRHGFGYSVFEHVESGIRSELTVFVALDASVKFTVLKVRNDSGRPRKLSATGYVEWVLGDMRHKTGMQVITDVDGGTGALMARNLYSNEFADRVSFFDTDDTARTITCDRGSFIGRNGSLRSPSALRRTRLSGKTGAALDPCAAIQIPFDLADGQEREIVFRLGTGRESGLDSVHSVISRFKGSMAARTALDAVRQYWQRTLSAVQVETPDPSVDLITNGWLMYQTIACRLWARSGYYQSGGAFGFRDQLQDTMALIHAEPRLMRDQLLLCASRQFLEGDVQHWWHPPAGRGVRTHCSDDYLWLPLAACRYVQSTGDTGVLDEAIHFLEGRPVNAEDDSYYDLPVRSFETGSVYQHCVRAIEHGLRFGEHGLPLMGTGDWNDGMDRVGSHGKGESVWLAFFLCEVLSEFTKLARLHNDAAFADRCVEEGNRLRQNIEKNAWDGGWYRRAYFDDGTPLGSASNEECQIDSISQSWSVLSGMNDETRSRTAMDAVYKRLVRRDDKLIQLLDPPFDKSELYPGYIRGYVPGVRENGGQYTHAAIWTTMAFAALGDSQRAWELFGIINPVNHGATRAGVAKYRVEPYVVCADVYGVAPHTGRGGWSWYTGSAGWMYRLVLESLLGLQLEGDKLTLKPCMPDDWQSFKIHYRYRETMYHISVLRTPDDAGDDEILGAGTMHVVVDGVAQNGDVIELRDDRVEHNAVVSLGLASTAMLANRLH